MSALDLALFAALGSALLHATWNALLKTAPDRTLALGVQNAVISLCGIVVLLFFAPLPEKESWPFIAATAVVQLFYQVFLLQAYKHGDLSRSYPIARGCAPLLVAFAGLILGDDILAPGGYLGLALVSLGIMSLILSRKYGGLSRLDKGLIYAVLTGAMIASYSVIDSRGVRLSGSAWGYAALLFTVSNGILAIAIMVLKQPLKWQGQTRTYIGGVAGGFMSAAGYSLVIWAYSVASAAEIVALRETSVIFGAAIGAFILKEGFGPRRVFSAALVALGVIVLKVWS